MRLRQTNASRALRNRSLYAIYTQKVQNEKDNKDKLALMEQQTWDVRKHIAFKRKKNYVVITDETKVSVNASLC